MVWSNSKTSIAALIMIHYPLQGVHNNCGSGSGSFQWGVAIAGMWAVGVAAHLVKGFVHHAIRRLVNILRAFAAIQHLSSQQWVTNDYHL